MAQFFIAHLFFLLCSSLLRLFKQQKADRVRTCFVYLIRKWENAKSKMPLACTQPPVLKHSSTSHSPCPAVNINRKCLTFVPPFFDAVLFIFEEAKRLCLCGVRHAGPHIWDLICSFATQIRVVLPCFIRISEESHAFYLIWCVHVRDLVHALAL